MTNKARTIRTIGAGAVIGALTFGGVAYAAGTDTTPQVKTVTVTDTSQVDALTAKVERLTVQRDKARDKAGDLRETLHGQYDVNADYADQIDALMAELSDVTGQRDDLAGDLQQVKNERDEARERVHDLAAERDKAAAETITVDPDADPTDVAKLKTRAAMWEGFTVGEVIVCPDGWVPADDTAPDGTVWAACM